MDVPLDDAKEGLQPRTAARKVKHSWFGEQAIEKGLGFPVQRRAEQMSDCVKAPELFNQLRVIFLHLPLSERRMGKR